MKCVDWGRFIHDYCDRDYIARIAEHAWDNSLVPHRLLLSMY